MVRYAGDTTWTRRWSYVLGLCMTLPLAGCASTYWTNPAKPSAVFADDAAACEIEAAQGPTNSDIFDADHYNAYLACLRGKGWELQQHP